MRSWTLLRRAVGAIFLTALLVSACGYSDTSSALFPWGPLSVAIKQDQPGFASGGTNPQGMDVALAKSIANSLGYSNKIAFSLISSPQRDGVIPGGTADIVIATYSITDKRSEFEDFAGPYLKTTQALLVRTNDNHFSKPWLAGLHGCTVGHSTPAMQSLPGNPVMTLKDEYSKCVDGVLHGSFDFVFTDTLILYGYQQAHEHVLKVVLAGTVGSDQYYGVALARGHHKLCEKINSAILSYTNSAWASDFQNMLPDAVNAYPPSGPDQSGWQSQFGITGNDVKTLSCRS